MVSIEDNAPVPETEFTENTKGEIFIQSYIEKAKETGYTKRENKVATNPLTSEYPQRHYKKDDKGVSHDIQVGSKENPQFIYIPINEAEGEYDKIKVVARIWQTRITEGEGQDKGKGYADCFYITEDGSVYKSHADTWNKRKYSDLENDEIVTNWQFPKRPEKVDESELSLHGWDNDTPWEE